MRSGQAGAAISTTLCHADMRSPSSSSVSDAVITLVTTGRFIMNAGRYLFSLSLTRCDSKS